MAVAVFTAREVDEEQIELLMTGGSRRTFEQSIDLEAPALGTGP